jgi:hypothetical protein
VPGIIAGEAHLDDLWKPCSILTNSAINIQNSVRLDEEISSPVNGIEGSVASIWLLKKHLRYLEVGAPGRQKGIGGIELIEGTYGFVYWSTEGLGVGVFTVRGENFSGGECDRCSISWHGTGT